VSFPPPHDLLSDAARQNKSGAIIVAEYEGKGYSFREDGWFNATDAAKSRGKDAHEWTRSNEADVYISALGRKYGKFPYLETRRGRHGGTWLHPKLATVFARWLNIDFALWCDEQIEKILRGESLEGDDDRLTTARERIPIHMATPIIYARTGMFYPQLYVAISKAAQADDFSKMKVSGLARVLPPLIRIGNAVDTQDDWRLLHANGVRLKEQPAQLPLGFDEKPDDG